MQILASLSSKAGSVVVSRAVILAVTFSTLLLGAGCSTATRDNTKTNADRTVAGRPPWAYPAGTPERQIVADMRSHLHTLATSDPNAEILAQVFFTTPASTQSVAALLSRYGTTGGESAFLAFLHEPAQSVMTTDFPSDVSTSEELQSRAAGKLATLTPSPDEPTYATWQKPGAPVNVGAFSAWGTAATFDRMWQDNESAIRGIGVIGLRGTAKALLGTWRPLMPGDPLR